MYDSAIREHDRIETVHIKKLEALNTGPIGQNYEQTNNKLIHNISSYTLTSAEERLLRRCLNFCIKNKITNSVNFKTDMEINALKLEPHCHPVVFATISHVKIFSIVSYF